MTEAKARRIYGEVTEEEYHRLRERIDVPRQRGNSMFRGLGGDDRGITAAMVRQTAMGIADMNPLYLDEEYAKKSIWGNLLVPPAILTGTEQANGATDGFPGCHTIWRNCELQWERPIFVGDSFSSTTYLRDVKLVDSEFSGKAAIQGYETTSALENGETLGYYRTSWHRFSRSGAKESSKYSNIERAFWSEEDLEEIKAEYKRQNYNRRGTQPLYWEDVEEGTEIPYIIKGPTTLTSKLAFEARGPGGWIVGHELAWELWDRHPGLPIKNEENVPEPPVSIHWTNERCQKYLGMPGAYEAGYERLNWLTQLLMSWMGDHGMLRKLGVQFRGFHWQGDVIRLRGEVKGKRVDGDRHLVDLSVKTVTQRDDITAMGEATVQLPSKASGKPVWTG